MVDDKFLEYGALGVSYAINIGTIAFAWKVFDKSSKQIDMVTGALGQSAGAQLAMAQAIVGLTRELDAMGDTQKDQRFDVLKQFDAFRRDIRKEIRETIADAHEA